MFFSFVLNYTKSLCACMGGWVGGWWGVYCCFASKAIFTHALQPWTDLVTEQMIKMQANAKG